MAKAKQQQELDGFERPSIPELDDLCAKHLKAEKKAKKAKDLAETNKAAVLAKMRELSKEDGKLEEDADDNHVYAFHDGDKEKIFKLCHDDSLRVTNAKKPKLEVVELEE